MSSQIFYQIEISIQVSVVSFMNIAENRTHPLAKLGQLFQSSFAVQRPARQLTLRWRGEIFRDGFNFCDIFFRLYDWALELDDLQHSVSQLIVTLLAGYKALDALVRAVEGLFQLLVPEHEVGQFFDQGIVDGKGYLK